MSITIAFGRWGLPYLVTIGRWEWTCFREADDAPRARRRWGIERSPGSEQQLSEIVVHCGSISHCFTRWPRRQPLPPAGAPAAQPAAAQPPVRRAA